MHISISVADRPCHMPQMMFVGDLEPICTELAAMGYDGVDLFLPEPSASDVIAARKALEANGLSATMLAAHGDLMKDGLFLNLPDKLSRLLEASRPHLDYCAKLNAMPNVGFFRGQHKNVPGGREESLKYMAEGLHDYCALAASYGVRVLLEPINRYEIDSIHTVDEALNLCHQAGDPSNLNLLLDIFHMNIEESSLTAAVIRAQGKIGHVHFVENTRAVPGLGCLNLGDLAECLGSVGYDGFLGIEAIPGCSPTEEARHGLAVVRAILSRQALGH